LRDDIFNLCLLSDCAPMTVYCATFPVSIAAVSAVHDFLDVLSQERCSAVAVHDLKVAVEEMFVNIVAHSDAGGQSDVITVTLDVADDAVRATLEDSAMAFDPLTATPPDLDSPLHERQTGGMGIYLARQLVDDMSYRREGGRNVLTLSIKV